MNALIATLGTLFAWLLAFAVPWQLAAWLGMSGAVYVLATAMEE